MALKFDVIVVGGGMCGGLSAAAYLQKAGAKVAIVERRHELATFAPTVEPWPGLIVNPHAAQNWSPFSPAIEDLELEKYGFRVLYSPIPGGVVHTDGTNTLLYPDPSLTRKAFAQFSEKDGKTIEKLQGGMLTDAVELAQTLFYKAPETQPAEIMDCAMGLGKYVDIDPDTFSKMSGTQLIEELFESDQARRTLGAFTAHNFFGYMPARGEGAFAVLASFFAQSAVGGTVGGMHVLAHAVTQCFVDHGGTVLRNCPVDQIIIRDGEAIGVRLSENAVYPGETIYADKAVISDVGARATLDLVGEEVMRSIDPKLAMKMKHWRTEHGGCVTYWLMKEGPSWKSEAWNRDIAKANNLYHAWDSWQEYKDWLIAMQNNDLGGVYTRDGELTYLAAVDPMGRSPEGYVWFRTYEPVPFEIEGGPERWDDVREELLEKRADVMEVFAPGFKDKTLHRSIHTPLDLWRYNPAAVGGQVVGGDFSEDQWILDRMPYRTGVKKLYMSNGVWPVAATWMTAGYNCACLVAEDLGVRDQPWWVHRPVEWLLRNLPRLIAA